MTHIVAVAVRSIENEVAKKTSDITVCTKGKEVTSASTGGSI